MYSREICMVACVFMASSVFSVKVEGQGARDPVIWIEAENPSSSNYSGFETTSMGKPGLLSGGEWIMKGVKPNEIPGEIPGAGVRLGYEVAVDTAGEYSFWMRVGWFRARADLRWRIDGGPWHGLPGDAPTRNLTELGFFTEASWADLGRVSLPGNGCFLEVLWPKVTDGKSRMLMALDCFAFVRGHFTPEAGLKPGTGYTDDTSRGAAGKVFDLPEPAGPERSRATLNGPWQVARYDDPDMDVDTYEPVRALPSEDDYSLRWRGFEVPGNPWDVPGLVFGHRLIYRTRVRVPKQTRGRGFKLHFSGTNWIVSVFVNGTLAGTHKGVWVPWDLDVTGHIVPGRINEIALAIKGTYYALDSGSDKGIHRNRNRPLSRKKWTRWVAPIYPSVKGDGDGYVYGIVNPVTFVCTGSAYTEDVFVKPSVEDGNLAADISLRNTGKTERALSVHCEALSDRTCEIEKKLGPVEIRIPAGEVREITLSAPWPDPRLWWPEPDPDLYTLRTVIEDGDTAVDIHEQTFGFREVSIEGTGLYINGIRRNLWNWVDVKKKDLSSPREWVRLWREEGSRFMRFSHGRKITQHLKSREERLAFYDRNGVAGRLCTMIDGMFISYRLMEKVGEGKNRDRILNATVWENFREHMAQVARAYRNHPSVLLYQVENELVYINGMNIYGSDLDAIESAMAEVVEAGRRVDPTRPYTVGGGGDLSGRLEVNAPHYPTASEDLYPENAYNTTRYSTKIERWPWDRSKPWQVGECSFAKHLTLGALVKGGEVFRSMLHARKAKAAYLRMLYGGYRWEGVSAFFPWDNLSEFEDARKAFSDLCAIPRKQTDRLYGGIRNELLFKIMNDSLTGDPVTFEWSYEADGERLAGESRVLEIQPGFGRETVLTIDAPAVTARLEGTLRLRVSQKSVSDFVDERSVPVLPQPDFSRIPDGTLVFDRGGGLTAYLRERGAGITVLKDLSELENHSGLLLVGPDTLTPAEAYSTDLLGFAVRGGRVVCLEQQTPPAGAALPCAVKSSTRMAGHVHPKALGTPLFRDLGKSDLIDWAGDHPTAKAVYHKPAQGARPLAVSGSELNFAPLIEVPCGRGVMVLCQLRVGAKLGVDPAADILLRNLIAVYGTYRPSEGKAALVCEPDSKLPGILEATGALHERVSTVENALDPATHRVAVIQATPRNLTQLNRLKETAEAFQNAGNWILLTGLTPKGMTEFNRFVPGQFLLRPFRCERVVLDRPDQKLAATLGTRDVALYSPEKIMHSTYWVSPNVFTAVIDAGQDVAPFTLPPGAPEDPFVYEPTRDDHDPYNFVNGMTADDFWRYTQQIWIDEDGSAPVLTFRFRRPETLAGVEIWNLDTYGTLTAVDIVPDGHDERAIHAELPFDTATVTVTFPAPVEVQHTLAIKPVRWKFQGRRNKEGREIRLVGINQVRFLRETAPRGCIPLDSSGGLVVFPKAEGGTFLCQIKFMDGEPKPANAHTKVALLAALLRNMGVGSGVSNVPVPGVNVRFHTVNLQESCNAFLDFERGEKAWFGAPRDVDMALLPRGTAHYADVPYHVTDYATAPIPDAIILGGEARRWNPPDTRHLEGAVTGIPVGRRTDVLYFLHTAHVGDPISDRERAKIGARKKPFVKPPVMKYVLNFVDGESVDIPVVLEEHIDHWIQETAVPLPGARIGWERSPDGLDGKKAVIFGMQVRNPRPGVEVASVDLVRVGRRAVPAILGITLGEVIQQRGN